MNVLTREKLEENLYGCSDVAIIDYDNYVIATCRHCYKGIQVEVYRTTGNQNGIDRYNRKIEFLIGKDNFNDTGHAVKWALNKIRQL